MVSLREIRVYAFGALPPPLRAHPGNAQLRIKIALAKECAGVAGRRARNRDGRTSDRAHTAAHFGV